MLFCLTTILERFFYLSYFGKIQSNRKLKGIDIFIGKGYLSLGHSIGGLLRKANALKNQQRIGKLIYEFNKAEGEKADDYS